MRSYWWKFLGLALVLYTLIGGLYTPLKTGITGVHRAGMNLQSIPSGEKSRVDADIYNPPPDFSPDSIILQNESHTFLASAKSYTDGMLSMEFEPRLGPKAAPSSSYNLYVKDHGSWMSFPYALNIDHGANDTAATNEMAGLGDSNPKEKLGKFPNKPILNESIRNLLYHVPMWFAMIFILSLAAIYNIRYLSKGELELDMKADSLIRIGIVTGIIGCITGAFWARVTWGDWWPRQDPKLNGVAIGMAMYLAYLLLRSGIRDEHQKARISAVYNLFVFPIFIALIIIMPKLSNVSLHPGSGGTVGFDKYDLNNTMRLYFYPAIIGWILVLLWVSTLFYRIKKLQYSHE